MPGLVRDDGVGTHSFAVEVDGVLVAVVSQVTGLRLERDVVEVQETGPDGTTVVRRLPGRLTPGEVVLTRGLSADERFERWMRDTHLGAGGLTDVTITVFDQAHQRVQAYLLTDAWPRRLEIGGLAAGTAGVATESLTLVYAALESA